MPFYIQKQLLGVGDARRCPADVLHKHSKISTRPASFPIFFAAADGSPNYALSSSFSQKMGSDRDAAALAEFWSWLEEVVQRIVVTEVEVADRLLEFRSKQTGLSLRMIDLHLHPFSKLM
ncbi:hypothetical protein Taro_052696 [Colocasia esculenta]|uniref:Uncharacterized protein n=1 Tax=Colocasia esculenta TaxID=4460 RepID=A0A843XJ31_COLES|nr:hypothetical protein [Colocasia esculenta]